ncbi:MAG TPA: FAD-dependent oxidoreductase [Thermoanaerobaculia bacterium]|nr:FAD-dependent oxidoreductase [Thermoanaerobaculia bacterium]
MARTHDCDVLILGAGLAGLSLARQLLLGGVESVLLLDRREIPPKKQKVGEATVQMSGYYYSRVLEMEEHLLRHHYLKYNLRFWWKVPGFEDRAEGYSQSYLRQISNIATYQLDRNVFEEGLLEACRPDPRFAFEAPISGLEVDLNNAAETADGRHAFRFKDPSGEEVAGTARWVVDASGRWRYLAKKLGLMTESPIRHGTSFVWVEGLLDAEKLTDLSEPEIRKRRDRRETGHMPFFLATNHFCGDGYWFWTIPLHGKTSLGLVYDVEKVDRTEVNSAEKLIDWVCRTFPMFARDLPYRKSFDHSGFVSFAHDCKQMISPDRWALSGEAGRFSDPLYSPGGDLISTHNTLIADAILRTPTQELLTTKARLYETLARAIYEGYVPSFAVSYNTLGDQEAFSLRYSWELAIYFFFYVFPFINDLFTNLTFLPMYLRRFSKLGPMNSSLQRFLADFQRWKLAADLPPPASPVFFEFSTIGPLKESQEYFYEIGVHPSEARDLLDRALSRLDVQARHAVAQVASTVLGTEEVLRSKAFAERFDVDDLRFDPEELARIWEETRDVPGTMDWGFDPMALRRALGPPVAAASVAADSPVEPVAVSA